MKSHKFVPWVATVVLLLVFAGVALAFAMGNVDGTWKTTSPYIDTNGALCDAWATGPVGGSTNYDSPTSISTSSPSIQGTLGGTDWNQVRYGSRDYDGGDCNCSSDVFAQQSGFGFDGVDDVVDPPSPYVNVSFLLGKWCHFNNPIYLSACDNPNDLDWVNLEFRVANIQCDPAADSLTPTPDGTMDFSYRFNLDETPNNGPACGGSGQPACSCPSYNGQNRAPCPYSLTPGVPNSYCPGQPGVNVNGCADAVDIGATPVEDTFTCTYGGGTSWTEYKIQILGFVPLASSTDSCPSSPSGQYSSRYISQEGGDRCACLYAQITEATGTAVDLLRFEVTGVKNRAITLGWETASETDNAGFNLYRAEAVEGQRVKINAELIPTKLPPGSPFGAVYEYTDTGVRGAKRTTYYFWLEDIDIYGNAELHGPVEASGATGPRKPLPVKEPLRLLPAKQPPGQGSD